MNKWVLAATAAIALAGPASAAVVTLENVSTNGPGDFTFSYQGTLGGDEGLRSGDRAIVYDFAGYIENSIYSPSDNVIASVEYTSPSGIVTPGFDDNPDLVNLVFTYVGPDFRNTGGPYASLDFDGASARSIYGDTVVDAFFTQTTKNNMDGRPGGSNTPVLTLGEVAVPTAAVPEPASWALMLGGFGLMGAAMRRRTRMATVAA